MVRKTSETAAVQSSLSVFLWKFLNGLCHDISTAGGMVIKPIVLGSQTSIGTEDELLTAKLLNHFFLKRFQGLLLILVSGEQAEREGDPVTVSK